MKNLKYKQLSFDTAIRNPERLRDFLEIFYKFENRVLDNECLLEIVCTLYILGVVTSPNVNINENTKIDDIKSAVIDVNKNRNAEGGFPRGVPTRFYNYTKTLSEFGLMYAQYNEPLKFAKTVQLWLNKELDAQSVFAIHVMMYNRYSPHRRVANDFNYFKFLAEVLKNKDDHKISYNEFTISLFHEDGNLQNYLDIIQKNQFENDNELYEWLCSYYGNTNKIGTVLNDYPDVVLRMLRITGFFDVIYRDTLYIKLNMIREELLNHLIEVPFEFTAEAKDNALLFFTEINNTIPTYLSIIMKLEKDEIQGTEYSNKLGKIIDTHRLTQEKVTQLLQNPKSESPKEFKYISDPLKLEFYISLLVYLKYGNELAIKPNYKIDSEGMPISHAPAYKGDIEVTSINKYWLIEVTLIRNKSQQLNNETTSVIRHFKDDKMQYNEKYLSFIAPVIHEDTKHFYQVSLIMLGKNEHSIYGATYSINNFIDTITTKDIFDDMKDYYSNAKKEVLDML